MLIGILTKLASFSLRRPKTVAIIAAVVVLGSLGAHYKMILAKNERLKTERAAYAAAVETFREREATLQETITNERVAAAAAAAERDEARRALDAFRAGREDDPEALEWAAAPVPVGELDRLCAALPEMEGCE